MSDNTTTISGNLTRDPELRYTQQGKPVAGLGVAVNRWMGPDKEAEVHFFDVTVWDDQAENVAACLNKGDRVVVTGRLAFRQYDDKEGNKRNAVSIVADEVGASLRWATTEITKVAKKGERTTPFDEELF